MGKKHQQKVKKLKKTRVDEIYWKIEQNVNKKNEQKIDEKNN